MPLVYVAALSRTVMLAALSSHSNTGCASSNQIVISHFQVYPFISVPSLRQPNNFLPLTVWIRSQVLSLHSVCRQSKLACACPCVDQILTQFPILFDVVFPKLFQDWLDALAIISLDLYTFVGIHCAA